MLGTLGSFENASSWLFPAASTLPPSLLALRRLSRVDNRREGPSGFEVLDLSLGVSRCCCCVHTPGPREGLEGFDDEDEDLRR